MAPYFQKILLVSLTILPRTLDVGCFAAVKTVLLRLFACALGTNCRVSESEVK